MTEQTAVNNPFLPRQCALSFRDFLVNLCIARIPSALSSESQSACIFGRGG